MTILPISKALAEQMSKDAQFANTWEHFAYSAGKENLLALASAINQSILDRDKCNATGENSGLIAVWRQVGKWIGPTPSGKDWIETEIHRAMPISIRFVNDLFYYWASARYGIVDPTEINSVREYVICDATQVFEYRPDFLITALGTQYEYVLRHLVFPPDHDGRLANELLQASRWSWLGNTLIEAAITSPEYVVPQLIHVLANERQSLDKKSPPEPLGVIRNIEFDRTRIHDIFQERSAEILAIIHANLKVTSVLPPGTVNSLRADAERLMQEFGSSSNESRTHHDKGESRNVPDANSTT